MQTRHRPNSSDFPFTLWLMLLWNIAICICKEYYCAIVHKCRYINAYLSICASVDLSACLIVWAEWRRIWYASYFDILQHISLFLWFQKNLWILKTLTTLGLLCDWQNHGKTSEPPLSFQDGRIFLWITRETIHSFGERYINSSDVFSTY